MVTVSPTPSSHIISSTVSISFGAADTELALLVSPPEGTVTVMARAFRFIIAIHMNGTWSAHSGELGKSTYKVLSRLANQGRLRKVEWPDTVSDRPPSVPASIFMPGTPMNKTDFKSWDTLRKSFMGKGRGPNLSSSAKDEVLKDAANVCMFRGCGKRVDRIEKSSRRGNVGQLAHIVGADPQGPRGRHDSHTLADKAENVMLVCYDHHRLIDAIDPEAYPIAALQEMRREHMQKVNSLLGQLAWERAMPLVIRGGIAGQSPAITFREISDGLESIQLSAIHPDGEHLTMAPIERPEEHYGYKTLSQLKPGIGRLITACQSGSYRPTPDNTLAVFAIHDTPVLVLAGRILGETRTAHVLQRTRGAPSPWRWAVSAKITSDVDLLIEEKATTATGAQVGLLAIALSDTYQEAWIPDAMRQSIACGQMPWISISAQSPRNNIVEAPCDLEHIMRSIREGLRRLQGDCQVQEIHMVIVAPVSVVFSIGRALQPGNHLPITVYQRVNSTKPFEPAIKIFSDKVENADKGPTISIPLQ